jgi:hypothetical protein
MSYIWVGFDRKISPQLLGERGYETKEVQPVDMFLWTGHCEVVTLLQRTER